MNAKAVSCSSCLFPSPVPSRGVTTMKKGALLVPQSAVTELQGSYQVAIVGSGNKISLQAVKVGERVDTRWAIDEGLKPGETIVAEGMQKIRPGMVVSPMPFAKTLPGSAGS